ncbi:hypothetical protein [Bradyrhizobium guangdongense]|uniref:hypothetical protein n=1 Tax=Bradyrhizobium guangdongense TaxID=1325090 RepID=UPI001AED8B1F|nr:hypothetical protein [Bradyrhizobium guangdongense]
MRTRADPHRDRTSMRTPVILVVLTLTAAILVAVLMLAGTRKSAGTTLHIPAEHIQLTA